MTSCPLQLDYGNVREDLGLVLTATIDRAEGKIGEKIKCDVSLHNIKGRLERLSFFDGEYFVLTLFDQKGEKIWTTMPNFLIGGPSRDMVLAPDKKPEDVLPDSLRTGGRVSAEGCNYGERYLPSAGS